MNRQNRAETRDRIRSKIKELGSQKQNLILELRECEYRAIIRKEEIIELDRKIGNLRDQLDFMTQ